MKSPRPVRRQGTGDRPGFQAPQPSTGQPVRHRFAASDTTGALVRGVSEALGAIPVHFRTTTRIDGLHAGDLFSLNAVMGNTIEVQVVDTLNRLRHVWDPDGSLPGHAFVRSAQTFPDVRLVDSRTNPVLGIELKG